MRQSLRMHETYNSSTRDVQGAPRRLGDLASSCQPFCTVIVDELKERSEVQREIMLMRHEED